MYIEFRGQEGHMHVHAPRYALVEHACDLFTPLDPAVATLTIRPRRSDPVVPGPVPLAEPSAWYDLLWTHPAPVEDTSLDALLARAEGEDVPLVAGYAVIAESGTLPAPAPVPVCDRIAAAPPATLDGLDAARIRLLGGPDEALAVLTRRRDAALRADRTAQSYDWAAWARAAAAVLAPLTAPVLTVEQRAAADRLVWRSR